MGAYRASTSRPNFINTSARNRKATKAPDGELHAREYTATDSRGFFGQKLDGLKACIILTGGSPFMWMD
ncbi:hypothetical protein HJFPF1_10524 [Paramyrothecium foliicola]|nr:hypothetical protein HJFPF1_10524 [Paramyrothecium foliicola]